MATIPFLFLLFSNNFRVGASTVSCWLSSHFLVSTHLILLIVKVVHEVKVLDGAIFCVSWWTTISSCRLPRTSFFMWRTYFLTRGISHFDLVLFQLSLIILINLLEDNLINSNSCKHTWENLITINQKSHGLLLLWSRVVGIEGYSILINVPCRSLLPLHRSWVYHFRSRCHCLIKYYIIGSN